MAVNGPQSTNIVNGPQGIQAPNFLRGPRGANQAEGARPAQAPDQLDISPAAAEAADAATADGDIRADLVARLRGEIASGTYDTPERLDAAVDRLLDEIG